MVIKHSMIMIQAWENRLTDRLTKVAAVVHIGGDTELLIDPNAILS